ncbi:MAG: fluoride efflux transporter CrcB [Bacteroidota bacterium]
MTKQIILVFLGGGLGSALRFLVTKYLNKAHFSIPYGTLTVNILGSLLLGIILGWAIKNNALNSNINLALAVGFCGGFTTFSTFAFENQSLLKSGDYLHFLIYTLGSIILGILAIGLGLFFSKSL